MSLLDKLNDAQATIEEQDQHLRTLQSELATVKAEADKDLSDAGGELTKAHSSIIELERERDEARYWLVRLYWDQSFRTYGDGIRYLAGLGLHPLWNMDAINALIAKVEGQK